MIRGEGDVPTIHVSFHISVQLFVTINRLSAVTQREARERQRSSLFVLHGDYDLFRLPVISNHQDTRNQPG